MGAAAAAREPTRGTPCSSSSSSYSSFSSSSSSDDSDNDPDYRVDDLDPRAATSDDKGNHAAGVVPPMPADAEVVASILRTQDDVDAVCRKYGVPKDKYTARPAGDLRACSSPPPGDLCVYTHALEAGMRVPLHPFFRDALAHFGIAPAQLMPNGWRIMAGFVVLCHSAGVPPSLAVFRHFFGFFPMSRLSKKHKGWYYFRSKETLGTCFEGLPQNNKDWKHRYFFLSSPEPWACPVEWGKPPESSLEEPTLNGEEEEMAERLLQVHDAAPVDLRTYLCDSNLAAAMISPAPPVPAAPRSCASISDDSISKGIDPSVNGMMKSILAENAAAAQTSASANKMRIESCSGAPLCGKKRRLDEADDKEGPPSSVRPNRPPAARGSSEPAGACSPAPGFSQNPTRFPDGHDDDDWEAARELLRGAVAPPQERVFAASRPSDVVASCYLAILQVANCSSFSLSYTLELEKKLAARDAEVAALRAQLEKATAELAAAKGRRRT